MREAKTSSDKADEKFFPVFARVHASNEFKKRSQESDYNNAHDTVVWLLIFEAVYGEPPVNDASLPKYYAPGVTDARWNTLLHSDEAYPAYQKFFTQIGDEA